MCGYTSRRGENRASVLSVFEKNVVFAIAKLLIFISKIIEFSRGKSSGFNMFACNLQGFLCWKRAGVFFLFQLSMRFCNMRPVFSKTFSLELCQRHCQILMLRINLGLTWPFTMVARLHGMADLDSLHIASTPPVWIESFSWCRRFPWSGTHEHEHPPHPTQPKTWRSMRVCRKFTWTWTSPPPHPTQDVT